MTNNASNPGGPNAGAVKVKPLVGWVIANGQGNRWRCVWKWETNAEWTDDISKAIKFATRDDAEAFSSDDEDAWLIQDVQIPAIDTTPDPRDAVIARLMEAADGVLGPLWRLILRDEDCIDNPCGNEGCECNEKYRRITADLIAALAAIKEPKT